MLRELDETGPPARRELRLACALGYFEVCDAERRPPVRRWGCPPAEAWVDACEGSRARYETLADAPLSIRLEPSLDAAERAAEDGGLILAHAGGRPLRLPSGRISVGDGAVEETVPWARGPQMLVWFARPDTHPRLAGATFDAGAPHHIIYIEALNDEGLAELEPEDMPDERQAYAEWHAINRDEDVDGLVRALDGPDPGGWRQLALLYRLRRLGARPELTRLADDAGRGLVAIVARSLLAQPDPVMGPATLDGLPSPV